MSTAEIIKKIRAVADDKRGDPRTRAVAQAKLEAYKLSHPQLFATWNPPPRNPQDPGMKVSDEYAKYRYMDLGNWGKSSKGNPTHLVNHKGRGYRVVLFSHRRTPTFGFLIVDVQRDASTFSDLFYKTLSEAHRGAWDLIQTI
jgi:hypothetical protein